MACSYMLINTNTIGYVWIIKVFLLVMLLTPYLLFLNNKLTNRSWWLLICSLLLAIESIACVLPILKNSNKYIYYIIYEIVPFSIAYTIPFMFGLRFRNVHSKVIMLISSLFVAFFICLFIINRFELAPQYKYPPRAIFIIYGVVSSLFLWLSLQNLSRLVNNGVSLFCGQHTIWIYIWHIPMIAIINHYFKDVWFARYILVYVSSIICFYIQYKIVNIIEQKIKSQYWKYLKN